MGQKTENRNSRHQEKEREKRTEDRQDKTEQTGGSWSLLKSGSERIKGIRLGKDQLLIGLLVGILLIVIALPVDKEKGEEARDGQEQIQPERAGSQEDVFLADGGDSGIQGTVSDEYTREMEERLAEILSRVEGVGRVEVLITWKTSSEKVVEKDAPTSSQSVEEEDSTGGRRLTTQESWEEETVYRQEADGSRVPYVVKEIRPQAEGVLVIAQGGGNSATARNILEAVQALFPLDSHKIKIMKMEGSK